MILELAFHSLNPDEFAFHFTWLKGDIVYQFTILVTTCWCQWLQHFWMSDYHQVFVGFIDVVHQLLSKPLQSLPKLALSL